MSAVYLLRYPLRTNQEQVQTFLSKHPKGKMIREAILSLKSNPRPAHYGFAEIDPETELQFLVQHIGIPVDKDTETVIVRYAPRCRIEVEGCEIVYDIDEKNNIVFLFKAHAIGSGT